MIFNGVILQALQFHYKTANTAGSVFGTKDVKQVYEPRQDETTQDIKCSFIKHHTNDSEENCTSTIFRATRDKLSHTRDVCIVTTADILLL
jgi:hypothetical protein